MVKTLSEFWNEVASICYDSSDYGIIAQVRSQFRTNEINKFVNAFIPGTEILKDGKNGTPVAMKGKADDDKGASGNEEIDFHGLQLFDYSDMKGDWMVVTFPNLEALEKHLLSEAGALNVYSSDMLVFEDGVFKPFEIMFNGDNDTVIPIDKDNFDTPLDIKAMQDRIWVRWMDPKELEPLTDEEVAEYRKSIGKSKHDKHSIRSAFFSCVFFNLRVCRSVFRIPPQASGGNRGVQSKSAPLPAP